MCQCHSQLIAIRAHIARINRYRTLTLRMTSNDASTLSVVGETEAPKGVLGSRKMSGDRAWPLSSSIPVERLLMRRLLVISAGVVNEGRVTETSVESLEGDNGDDVALWFSSVSALSGATTCFKSLAICLGGNLMVQTVVSPSALPFWCCESMKVTALIGFSSTAFSLVDRSGLDNDGSVGVLFTLDIILLKSFSDESDIFCADNGKRTLNELIKITDTHISP